MNNLETLIKSRRSAMKFVSGVEIPKSDLDEIFSISKFAPSAFNTQPTHYVVVTDNDLKEKVYEAAYKQYKVKTASALIIALGDTKAYKEISRINEGMLHLGILSKQEFDKEVEDVNNFYDSRGETFQKEDAIRNACLSAMQLMLIAKDKGWDTCPMIGFDPDVLRQILNIPDQYVPALLIAMGKADTTKERARGYRKPVGEFVSYNSSPVQQ
ncbi:nitroreductase family protein [Paenibacillus sp. L3-i20]|uniref:nitroreductase family protein n=1 Tax=Paenibacillus sp. L3-i20 TaxID=2905833 RepID=UPI001EE080AD|nr:nitroreductase family protein [Paenibacillus sp. L3-i20]GKU77299.1 nitroreductase [Paenibacillus sp. L3-i20]